MSDQIIGKIPEELQDQIRGLSREQIDDLFWEDLSPLYDQRPVDIDTFIESPYYLGEHLEDPNTGLCKIYPFWREKLREIYPSPYYNRYDEVLVMLGIGNGKSTISNISCLYEIYKLLCIKDPQSYYKLMKSTIITFVIFSANKYTAENVNWPQLKAAMEDSPWFQEYCPIVTDGKRVALDKDNCVTLPKGLSIQLGSNEKHTLGRAVIWGVVDEANFQSENSQQAYNSYNAIAQRRTSRFQDADSVPGVLWIVSSPKSDLDFVAHRIETQKKIDTTLIIKDIPSWEIKPDAGRSGKTFKLFVGDSTADPKIIEDGEDYSNLNPSKVLDVPVEFRRNFEKDLIKAIMDIAGRSSVSDFALFPNASHLTSLARIKNRVGPSVVRITTNGPDEIYDYVDQGYFKDVPQRNCNRYLHIDIGLKGDRLAICGAYSFKIPQGEDMVRSNKEDIVQDGWEYSIFQTNKAQDGVVEEEKDIKSERMYVAEFILYVKNVDKDKEVPLIKVARFIRWLKNIRYPMKKLTYDLLGRGMFAQIVSQDVFTEYLSVDRDKEPYLTLKKGMSEDLVVFPFNEVLIRELRQLRDVGKKIDHPENTGYDKNGDPIFSKDGADALCGAVFSAMTDMDKENFSSILDIDIYDDEDDVDPYSINGLKSLIKDQMRHNVFSKFV